HPVFLTANQAKEYGYIGGEILPNAGHLRVNVSPKGVKVDYVRAYLQKNESSTRKNKEISASYFINPNGCYDKNSSNIVLWNTNYIEEIVYPNPFEQFVTFSFKLSAEDQVNLFIVNESGQVIKQLLRNASTNNGQFQAYWDGKNEAGLKMPTGTYYYQLTSQNSTTKSGKLILSNP
ncbi:MAG: FlgD immunoglobulin-like domain containing protein, partial [Aquirufa sp.]